MKWKFSKEIFNVYKDSNKKLKLKILGRIFINGNLLHTDK